MTRRLAGASQPAHRRRRVHRALCVGLALCLGLVAACAGERGAPETFDCRGAARHPPAPGELLVAGSGAVLPLARAVLPQLAEARMRAAPSVGSGGALAALAAGDAEIALVSRALTAAESEQLEATLVLDSEVGLATTHAGAPARWTDHALLALWQGQRRLWPDGRPVRRLLREPGDSGAAAVAAAAPTLAEAMARAAQRGAEVLWTDQEQVEALAADPDAIGVADRALLALQAPAVALPAWPAAWGTAPRRPWLVVVRRDAPPALRSSAQALAAAMRARAEALVHARP